MLKRYNVKKFGRIKKGFTLVETLVAIAIFTSSILALLVVLSQGVSNANYAKRKTIASYLAQEGVEYIRNMRDTYVLYDAGGAQAGWNNFNTNLTDASACQAANGCYFNADALNYGDPSQPMIDINLTACGAACPQLLYDSATGKYNYTTGTVSSYIRKITSSAVNANETKITSTVSWTQGSGTYYAIFSENLSNWVE